MGLEEDQMDNVATMIFPEQTEPAADFSKCGSESEDSGEVFNNDGGHMERFQTPIALKSKYLPQAASQQLEGLQVYAPFACGGELNGTRFVDQINYGECLTSALHPNWIKHYWSR